MSADSELPRVLCDTAVVVGGAEPDAAGALWRLQEPRRDLDANLVQLPAGSGVEAHAGPEVDVLVSVVHGSGRLITAAGVLELRPGVLVWLPRRSRREISAGPDGLRYLTVHQRRAGVTVQPRP
jgi:quercetin dioxygenase-like cupin family protein